MNNEMEMIKKPAPQTCRSGWIKILTGTLLSFGLIFLPFVSLTHAAISDSFALKMTVDLIAPDAISNLIVQTSTGTETEVVLNWTEPGDDGISGQASAYLVRYSTHGNINDLVDFGTATVINPGWIPGSGGGSRAETFGSLTPGQTYYWAIRAEDPAGLRGTWSRSTTINPDNFAQAWDEPPGEVQGVTAVPNATQITVSWTDLSLTQKTTDFDRYRIYRSTQADFKPEFLISSVTTPTSFADIDVTTSVAYYYRVVGVDRGVDSESPFPGSALESLTWSTATAIIFASTPLAPSNLQITSIGTHTLVWQWLDNSDNEEGFKVRATTGGLITQLGTNTTFFAHRNLAPGTSFSIDVRSFNAQRESTGSTNLSAFTLANPPVNLVRSTATASTISLVWQDNNNGPETLYILERATFPLVDFTTVAIVTQTAHTDTGLADLTTYTYRLHARNGDGVDSASIELSTSTIIVKPGRIDTLAASQGPEQDSVTLSWVAPGDNGTEGNIVDGLYDIRWSTTIITSDSDFENVPDNPLFRKAVSTDTIVGSSQGLVLTGLNFNAVLYFAIKTRDEFANNFSELSNVANTSIQADVSSPAAVTSLAAALVSDTSANLTWIAPGDDGTSGDNSSGSYDVRYGTEPIDTLSQFLSAPSALAFGVIPSPSNAGSQETMTLTGLSVDTTYHFRLRTQDDSGNISGLSNAAMVSMPDTIQPGAVQSLTAAPNLGTGRRIDLTWVNPAASDLAGIRIIVSTDGFVTSSSSNGVTFFDLTQVGGSVPTSFNHTGLTPGVTYFYSVFAFDDETVPNFSARVSTSAVPVDTSFAIPSKPENIRGTFSSGDGSFTITWDTPTTRSDGTALAVNEISSYKIIRLTGLRGTTSQITVQSVSSGTSFTDFNVAGNIFFYKIRTIDTISQESEDSDLVAVPSDPNSSESDVFVVTEDPLTIMVVPSDAIEELREQNVELGGFRKTQEEGGEVFKSIEVRVTDEVTGEVKKGFVLSKPMELSIGFLEDVTGAVSNGSPAVAFTKPLPQASEASPNDFSIYWHSGSQWIKLGTTVDTVNNTANVETRHTGAYQLRLVAQAAIQQSTVFPRTITPNGDGINDVVFFFFENQTGSPAQGTIYDIRSAKIAALVESNIFGANNNILTWNGKDEKGNVVPGGVYLYKIDIGDKTFTGTVAVAR